MLSPERKITHLSIWVNVGLTALKLAAGVFGRSQALIADAAPLRRVRDMETDLKGDDARAAIAAYQQKNARLFRPRRRLFKKECARP